MVSIVHPFSWDEYKDKCEAPIDSYDFDSITTYEDEDFDF